MRKILIAKNIDRIVISQDGKKLVIDKDNELFEKLQPLDKREIINWFCNRAID